ncbi:hypothetical protein J3A83DRAFT_1428945 [Scleroderma citrinum]
MASPQFQEPVLHTSSLDNDWTVGSTDSFTEYYDPFLFPAGAGASSYDHYPEHGCPWQNTDIVYHHSDNFAYSSNYSPFQSFDSIFPAEHTIHQKSDVDGLILTQSNLSMSSLSQPVKSSCPRQGTFPSHDQHRSSIALASDTYLSQASSLSSDVHSSMKRESSFGCIPTSHFQSNAGRHTRPPSKKRSIEALEGYNVKGIAPICLLRPQQAIHVTFLSPT